MIDKKQIQISVIVPEVRIADVTFNTHQILRALDQLPEEALPHLVLFPELCISGATCGDLFLQPLLQQRCLEAVEALSHKVADKNVWAVVGLPLKVGENLFDAAFLLGPEGALGISLNSKPSDSLTGRPSNIFQPGHLIEVGEVNLFGCSLPTGTDLSLLVPELSKGRLQVIVGNLARGRHDQDAEIILNPCCLPALATLDGEAGYYGADFSAQHPVTLAACSCGHSESTANAVYSGMAGVWQNGLRLAGTDELQFRVQQASVRVTPGAKSEAGLAPQVVTSGPPPANPLSQRPFIRSTETEAQLSRVFAIQVAALVRRMRHTCSQKVVLGISGGSDSSLALLVCLKAFDEQSLDRRGIFAISLPGPGSTTDSKERSLSLADLANVTRLTIPIGPALESHLADIGHPAHAYDVTYENAQARERTQILMDLANQVCALHIGTGDLSEITLGWCTYNGDHMAMYDVNAGVPKTLLMQVLVWAGESLFGEQGKKVAMRIAEAPVSPELLPPDEAGNAGHTTEGSVGPYLLHDFFLYHAVGLSQNPREVFNQASQAFNGLFSPEEILSWLKLFYSRLFSQQFKRSASPDGPQVTSVSLSSHSGWAVPSDASGKLWLNELENL